MFIKQEVRKSKQAESSPANQFFEVDLIKNTVNLMSGYVSSAQAALIMRKVIVGPNKLLADVSREFDSIDNPILRANFLFKAMLLGNFHKLIVLKNSSKLEPLTLTSFLNEAGIKLSGEKNIQELEKIIKKATNIRIEKILGTDVSQPARFVLAIQCPGEDNFQLEIADVSLLGLMVKQIITPKLAMPYADWDDEEEMEAYRENFLKEYNLSGFQTIFNGHFSVASWQPGFYIENSEEEKKLLSAYGNLEIAYHLLTQENVTDEDYHTAKQFFAKAVFAFNKFYFSGGNVSMHLAYIVSPMLATMNLLASREKNKNTVECIKILEAASIFRDVFLEKMKEIYKDKFGQVSSDFLNESAKLEQLCQEVVNQIKSSQSASLANMFFNAKNISLGMKCNLLDGLKLTNEERQKILQNLAMQADTLWYQADIKEKRVMILKVYQPLVELMNKKELESLLNSSEASIEIKTMICRNLVSRTDMNDVKAVDHLIKLINDFRITLKETKLDENSLKDKDELCAILHHLLAIQMNFDTGFEEVSLTDEYLDKLMDQWSQFPNEKKQEKKQEESIEKKEQKPGLFSQSEYQRMQLQKIQKEKAIKYYLETVPPMLDKLSTQVVQTQGLLSKLKETMAHVIDKEEFHSTYFPDKEDKDQLESPLITRVNLCLGMFHELEDMFKKNHDIIMELKRKNHPQADDQYDPMHENVQQKIATAKSSTTYNLDVQMIKVEKLFAKANEQFRQLSTQLSVKNRSLKDIYNDSLKPAENTYLEMEKIAGEYLELAKTLDAIVEDSIQKVNNPEFYPMQQRQSQK
ncbi:hypothetical protein OQJ13_11795 [Legionella sp. PATHC035]|uniref:hypothetical protein n=1 Tax=Legionella sp. PATHC035 TaxID=2992040 RepID=UPI0022437A09|nr:hypothetical protein [Legionella sp. PATHC035]MCW8409654.1 hypothetical protein [Legionella sp. PATHC035]